MTKEAKIVKILAMLQREKNSRQQAQLMLKISSLNLRRNEIETNSWSLWNKNYRISIKKIESVCAQFSGDVIYWKKILDENQNFSLKKLGLQSVISISQLEMGRMMRYQRVPWF